MLEQNRLAASLYNKKVAMWSCFILMSVWENYPWIFNQALTPSPTSLSSLSLWASLSEITKVAATVTESISSSILPVVLLTTHNLFLQDICRWPYYVWMERCCKAIFASKILHVQILKLSQRDEKRLSLQEWSIFKAKHDHKNEKGRKTNAKVRCTQEHQVYFWRHNVRVMSYVHR